MRPAKKMAEGVLLLGLYKSSHSQFDPDGCWLLHKDGEAAVVDLPPFAENGETPFGRAREICEAMSLRMKYLLCTHADSDHFSKDTLQGFQVSFPDAAPHLQRRFSKLVGNGGTKYFGDDEMVHIELGGEPLFLIHAPKHSPSDTIIVFRGSAILGDWELGTLRSINDRGPDRVPISVRRESIDRLLRFAQEYEIHTTISSRANDVRRHVHFGREIASTLIDRDFGWGAPISGDD